MKETLVLTFRQIYTSSLEYNLNYKTSVLNLLYNTFYSRSKLKTKQHYYTDIYHTRIYITNQPPLSCIRYMTAMYLLNIN